jgi:hypothetical protein
MMVIALLAVAVSVVVAGAVLRPLFRRRRWCRQLLAAGSEVQAAMADGRIAADTGEALLQHLEGLRRECRSRREE